MMFHDKLCPTSFVSFVWIKYYERRNTALEENSFLPETGVKYQQSGLSTAEKKSQDNQVVK